MTTPLHRRTLGPLFAITTCLGACGGSGSHVPPVDAASAATDAMNGQDAGGDVTPPRDAGGAGDAGGDGAPAVLQVPPTTPITSVAPTQMRQVTLTPAPPAGNPCGWLGPEWATGAAFTPDGKLLVTTAGDGLRVYDAQTGAPVRAISPGRGTAGSLSMSGDGALVAAVTGGAPTVYRVADGAQLFAAPPEAAVNPSPVALSPDGTRLTFGTSTPANASNLDTWSLASGQRTGSFMISAGFYIDGLAYAPSGDRVAVGTADGHLQIWSLTSGQKTTDIAVMLGGSNAIHVSSLSYSPDGAFVGAASDVGAMVYRLPGLTPVADAVYGSAPVFSADSRMFAVRGGADAAIDIHSLTDATIPIVQHISPSRATTLMAFSRADDRVALVGPHALAVQALGTGQVLWSADGDAGISAVAPDGGGFLTINPDGELRSWSAMGRLRSVLSTPLTSKIPAVFHNVRHFDVSPDGHRLAALAPYDVETLSLDQVSATTPLVVATESGVPEAIHFAPDGAVVLTMDGHSVTEWGALDARRRRVFQADPQALEIFDARYSPDGALLAVGGPVLDVWRRSDGALLRRLQSTAQQGSLDSLAFSPSGAMLATCDRGGVLSLWATATWTIPLSTRPYTERCRVAFTPDGKGVLTWSETDAAVRLWSATDLAPIAAMPAYGLSNFVGVASMPGGAQVAGVEMNDARSTFLYCVPSVP